MVEMNKPTREVARKIFGRELLETTLTYKKGSDPKAPGFVLTPTGCEANKLYITGIVTDIEKVNDDPVNYKLEIIDAAGKFYAYASQFKPQALAAVQKLAAKETPCYIAMTAKLSISPGKNDPTKLFKNINVLAINEVDDATYIAGSIAAFDATVERLNTLADPANELGKKALETYQTNVGEFKEMLSSVVADIERRTSKPADNGGASGELSMTTEDIPAEAPKDAAAEAAPELKAQVVSKKKDKKHVA
jgi:RPA family protein